MAISDRRPRQDILQQRDFAIRLAEQALEGALLFFFCFRSLSPPKVFAWLWMSFPFQFEGVTGCTS